jgi:hypothetical protein
VIRDFGALQAWHPAVEASPADQGNTIGSMRRLALKGGGALVETLEAHDEAQIALHLRAADGGALPVTGYRSTIQVAARRRRHAGPLDRQLRRRAGQHRRCGAAGDPGGVSQRAGAF